MSANERLVSDYLDTLDAELAGIPRAGRREVLDEIEGHIRESLAELDPGDEAGGRNVLDRIGEPAEIAAEARDRFGITPAKTTWREIGALILLPIGGFILPVLGWFVAVVLLWVSEAWNTRDKLIGTFVVPCGVVVPLAIPALVGGPRHILILPYLLVASLALDCYLFWRLNNPHA